MSVISKPEEANVLLPKFYDETCEYITALQRYYELIIYVNSHTTNLKSFHI
jgi:hypothetical protein